jgi:phosphate transport system substrate-binding protein
MQTLRRITRNIKSVCLVFIFISFAAGCGGPGNNKGNASGSDNTLLGAGSTFINPLFSKIFSEYNKSSGIKVNYQSIGS